MAPPTTAPSPVPAGGYSRECANGRRGRKGQTTSPGALSLREVRESAKNVETAARELGLEAAP